MDWRTGEDEPRAGGRDCSVIGSGIAEAVSSRQSSSGTVGSPSAGLVSGGTHCLTRILMLKTSLLGGDGGQKE